MALDLRAAEVDADSHARGFSSFPPARFQWLAPRRQAPRRPRIRPGAGDEALLDPRGALAVTLGALTLAMLLGSASFDFRRYTVHRQRLQKVLREQPGRSPDPGPGGRGATLLAVARTREEVEREASSRGGKSTAEIREKGARHAETRVYQSSDMLYFVFFDGAD